MGQWVEAQIGLVVWLSGTLLRLDRLRQTALYYTLSGNTAFLRTIVLFAGWRSPLTQSAWPVSSRLGTFAGWYAQIRLFSEAIARTSQKIHRLSRAKA